ncbi:MAG: CTP synthase [Candidatus Aenigmarchaeota archaeon]|nr:CTP synthase [Candidatus Aenigmarchaeota archaeon]
MQTKFIFILGGGYSGLGKGIVTSSIARIIKNLGFKIKICKIDPYFNFGAGDQNPNEHGEVFVTEDGGEIDQDFGYYERFTAVPCKKDYNITSGKIFWNVINNGLKGKYLGKTIQLIPHIRDEIKRQLYEISKDTDFLIVEVGGTIGDDESLIFIRAISSMIYEDNIQSMIFVLAPLIFNDAVGEPKTKIVQNAIKELNTLGIKADAIILRTQYANFLDEKRKEKINIFCNVSKENIFVDPDIDTVYKLPLIFSEQNLTKTIIKKFSLERKEENWNGYLDFIKKIDDALKRIPIAYVGKYVREGSGVHKDAYISVEEALKRACIEFGFLPEIHRIDACECEKDLSKLSKVAGIIVPGGYGSRGFEGKINAIKFARENNIPFLGLCLGLQLGVIEFARNVCGINGAHTDEQDEEGYSCNGEHVVCILPEQEKIRKDYGFIGTQRLGDFACIFKKDSFIQKLYEKLGRPSKEEREKIKKYPEYRIGKIKEDDFIVFERHRHRREINPKYHEILEKNGMEFLGVHNTLDGTILVEVATIKGKPWLATQFHPEFNSNYLYPNPFFYWFAGLAQKRWEVMQQENLEKLKTIVKK